MVYCSHVCSIRHWQTGRERLWQNINKWKTYEKHVCVHVIIIFLLLWNARFFSFSWLLFEVALREVSRSLILWKRHTLDDLQKYMCIQILASIEQCLCKMGYVTLFWMFHLFWFQSLPGVWLYTILSICCGLLFSFTFWKFLINPNSWNSLCSVVFLSGCRPDLDYEMFLFSFKYFNLGWGGVDVCAWGWFAFFSPCLKGWGWEGELMENICIKICTPF